MNKWIKNIIKWFSYSNRYKHLAVGIIIGILSLDFSTGVYASWWAGTACEYKDYCYNKSWDWTDFILTFIGGVIGSCFYIIN